MNINDVYIASIWMLLDVKIIKTRSFLDFDAKVITGYVKKTLIYYKNGEYYDLKTRKNCKTYVTSLDVIGTQFVNLEKGIVPLSNIIDYKRENMSKRKILKKYNEVKDGGRKE